MMHRDKSMANDLDKFIEGEEGTPRTKNLLKRAKVLVQEQQALIDKLREELAIANAFMREELDGNNQNNQDDNL